MLRVSGDGLHRCGSGLEQDGVDHRLVAKGEVTDRCWQGKDQVVILDWQQIDLARFEPAMSGTALAPGAMAITAGNGVLSITCLMGSTS